jgi:AraC family transcriptional regulator
MDRRPRLSNRHYEPVGRAASAHHDRPAADAVNATVEISPPDIVRRRIVAWDGMTGEIVQATRREKIEYRFRAPLHLLAVCEQGMRNDGDTFVEGLPRSSLRDLKKKLTFVPAGHEYHDWQKPRILSRVVYFYFDPAKMPAHSESDFADLAPRLHFEDAALLDTALKLTTLIESPGADNRLYLEALGVVLAHELARLNPGGPPPSPGAHSGRARGVAATCRHHLYRGASC